MKGAGHDRELGNAHAHQSYLCVQTSGYVFALSVAGTIPVVSLDSVKEFDSVRHFSHLCSKPRPPGRRLLLRRIGYHLYYRVHEENADVEILAFWHTSRGSSPDLKT